MQILFYMMLAVVGQAAENKLNTVNDENLRGLGKFQVIVEDFNPESPVTMDQILTDTELRLRSLGIELKPKGGPYLYIMVNTIPKKIDDIIFAYIIGIDVTYIDIALLSSGKRAQVNIWHRGSTGYAGIDVAEELIRKGVKDLVDKFANAWLKTHPKDKKDE